MNRKLRLPVRGLLCFFACAVAGVLPLVSAASKQTIIKKPIGSGINIVIQEGRTIYLEMYSRSRAITKTDLAAYVARDDKWQTFVKGRYAKVPLLSLREDKQRTAVRVLFPDDYWSEQGWVHFIRYGSETGGGETLWSIAEWFTGKGTLSVKIKSANSKKSSQLYKNEKIVIPRSLLLPAFSRKETGPIYLGMTVGDLTYKRDEKGDYALYKLKKGETVYTDVVARFTPRTDNDDVNDAVRIIAARSGIRNPDRLDVGQEIKIPIELLSSKYRPYGDSARTRYEETVQNVAAAARPKIHTDKLAGVHVILDPGHGGHDPGKAFPQYKVEEDEYVYDIVCRVKRLLEQNTRAVVHLTLLDERTGYTPIDRDILPMDENECLLTHPRYKNRGVNGDAKISVNLRWYLANSIYRKLIKGGVSAEKVVFTSFHADSRAKSLRGTMVYYPDAHYCRGRYGKNTSEYRRYSEVREKPYVEMPFKSRIKAQQLSQAFANEIISTFRDRRKHNVAVQKSEPVRGVVRRRVGRRYAEYVPAVIRYCEVPTRVLIETLNLNNYTDRMRIKSWKFRERVARAYVDALEKFYSS